MMTSSKPTKVQKRVRTDQTVEFHLRAVETDGLPEGVCGRIVGVGLRYNVVDTYGTMFMPGCLAKTGEKVRAGKVKLYADHRYVTDNHVGVVREITDVGDDVLVSADLLDTQRGRQLLEYAKACKASGAQTGLSIGFYDRDSEWIDTNGARVLAFSEVELEEFSMTPANAVEGADLLNARKMDPALKLTALKTLLQSMSESDVRSAVDAQFGQPKSEGNAAAKPDSAADEARNAAAPDSREATAEDRLAAYRQSFQC